MIINSVKEIRITRKTPGGDEYGFVISGDNVKIELNGANEIRYDKYNKPSYSVRYSPYSLLVADAEISIDGEFEDEKNYTLERLMRNLSANDMIEYMKDRGMAYCPMIK
jgi:hypothetical protein